MFEKEAEEIMNNHCDCELLPECMEGIRCRCSEFEESKKLLIEGIEFGYNKANEWHYVKDGDLPIFETELLCQKYSGRCFVGYYHYNDNKFYPYEKGNSYDVTEVIAWKEIVLPELKESE